MIRVTGLLAIAASATLAILLICSIHSAELTGQVSDPELIRASVITFTNVSDPEPRAIYIQSKALPFVLYETELAMNADFNASYEFGHVTDSGWVSYWIVHLPEGAAKAAKTGDELIIRAQSLTLMAVGLIWTDLRLFRLMRGLA